MNTPNTINSVAGPAPATTPWSGVTQQHQGQLPLGSPQYGANYQQPSVGGVLIGNAIQLSANGNVSINGSVSINQTAYMFYKWNLGYDFPKELLISGVPLVPALYIDNACTMMFHISVWIEVCKPNTADFGVMWDGKATKYSSLSGALNTTEEFEGVLMIKQGVTFDTFNVWWKEYTSRFDGDSWKFEQLPLVKEGKEISGCPIAHGEKVSYTGKQIMATDKLFDRWCWIVERTSQPVWFSNDFWFFNNTSEMLMYKLIDEK